MTICDAPPAIGILDEHPQPHPAPRFDDDELLALKEFARSIVAGRHIAVLLIRTLAILGVIATAILALVNLDTLLQHNASSHLQK